MHLTYVQILTWHDKLYMQKHMWEIMYPNKLWKQSFNLLEIVCPPGVYAFAGRWELLWLKKHTPLGCEGSCSSDTAIVMGTWPLILNSFQAQFLRERQESGAGNTHHPCQSNKSWRYFRKQILVHRLSNRMLPFPQMDADWKPLRGHISGYHPITIHVLCKPFPAGQRS